MLEDFTHGTLEINRGRWFINDIITLSSESSNATSGAHCIHLCYTVCVYLRCRDFLPKCFSIEKLRLQEAQHWLFFNRDLLPLLLLHLYKQIFFSYMEKLCCFCDIGSSFTCFSKNAAKFLWLWYMNWNKRVRSERRKSHFRGPRFQCEMLCMHQSAQELDPPLEPTTSGGKRDKSFVPISRMTISGDRRATTPRSWFRTFLTVRPPIPCM
jgi:hypothetical protein